ncbi:Multimeric flavodoxin WrbA [Amycolatopsis xylanica]|uniref:Multimeric flavodoxin WrbA n=1 Tax=Amycolatopsis xylanica TaxID=589385 RepID=A0A1H3M5S1_9PSEU|nr:NAD(P)H-dependent oxidoreductase [Amycolatopsis xylanica]SDY71644.1 Multimeric flavodoxin WrbA [Amycolatopsis xylanica]
MTDDRKFLFLLGSARTGGNTETLTREAARPVEATQRWLRLTDLPLPRFQDARHDGRRYLTPSGNEQELLDATLEATDIVISSPVYWYSVSADVKLYLDYWSGWLYVPGVDFKARMRGKTLWGVSVLSEGPEQAEPVVGTLRRSAEYLGMNWGGVLLGNGSRPDDILKDSSALTAAETFFAKEFATV